MNTTNEDVNKTLHSKSCILLHIYILKNWNQEYIRNNRNSIKRSKAQTNPFRVTSNKISLQWLFNSNIPCKLNQISQKLLNLWFLNLFTWLLYFWMKQITWEILIHEITIKKVNALPLLLKETYGLQFSLVNLRFLLRVIQQVNKNGIMASLSQSSVSKIEKKLTFKVVRKEFV